MKEETKKLIVWIKRHISVTVNDDVELHNKAFDFLNSIPEIESHLCNGGYIQDRNGTPCCHGDKVKFQYDEGFYNGTLTFNFTFKCFTIVNENGVFFWMNNGIKWFEKVKY